MVDYKSIAAIATQRAAMKQAYMDSALYGTGVIIVQDGQARCLAPEEWMNIAEIGKLVVRPNNDE